MPFRPPLVENHRRTASGRGAGMPQPDSHANSVAHKLSPASDGRGLGLVGNAERLARLGGIFDVRSSPQGGTVVLLEAPRL